MDNKNNNSLPFDIEDIDQKTAEALMKYYTGEKTGFVRVGPNGYFMPHKFKELAVDIYNMPVRTTDVFVASYPRSGTTWTQELVWMVANDLDYAKAEMIPLTERFIFIEFSAFFHPKMIEIFKEENSHSPRNVELVDLVSSSGVEQLAKMTGPRFIKTHLPISILPPNTLENGKMVYIARDPRDVAVSFYHLNRTIRTQGYIGDFRTYWTFFINDLHHWTPYFEHLKEAWENRDHPNMLFLFYEDLSKDLSGVIRRVASFLGKNYSDDQIESLREHLYIDNFKNNKSVNYDIMGELNILVRGEQGFVRKGKSGGWREYFDEEMTRQAEQWMEDNLRGTDFRFPHITG